MVTLKCLQFFAKVVISLLSLHLIITRPMFMSGEKENWQKFCSSLFNLNAMVVFNAGEQSKIIDIIRDNQVLLLNEWEKVYPPEEDNNDE